MSWHYRILRHPDGSLALHEVYGDEAGAPDRHTVEPIRFVVDAEEGVEGLTAALQRALRDATERPVLNVVDFPIIPNAETIEAMKAARRGELIRAGRSSGELIASLNEDDDEAWQTPTENGRTP